MKVDGNVTREICDQLKHSVQVRIGDKFKVVDVLDVTALMTEVVILDAQNHPFQARVYNLNNMGEEVLTELWADYESKLKQAMPKPLIRSHGMQRLGSCWAHVASVPAGMDLNTYLRQVGACRAEFAQRVCVQVIQQLAKPAEHEIYHPALKPSDIILTADGRVAVKNIGLSAFEQELADRMALFDLDNAGLCSSRAVERRSDRPHRRHLSIGRHFVPHGRGTPALYRRL